MDDGTDTASIDRPVLEYLRERLVTTEQIETAAITDADGHLKLRTQLSNRYYQPNVVNVVLTIRWFTNDDFMIHYREEWDGRNWECRWDRHPNSHNKHSHFHPPPDAATPAEDSSWSTDYRAVIRIVFNSIEVRISNIWDEQGRNEFR